MTKWKLINAFHIPQEVWDKAEIKAEKLGWTVEAVLCDSLEKAFDYYEEEDEEIQPTNLKKYRERFES